MAKFVLKDAFVSINGVDLSDHVEQIELTHGANLEESQAMGANSLARLPALKDWTLTLTFRQDFAAASVDATLFPLVGAADFPVEVRPTSAAVGPTNPKFTGNGLVESYSPLSGSVGEVANAPVTIQAGSGDLVRATS